MNMNIHEYVTHRIVEHDFNILLQGGESGQLPLLDSTFEGIPQNQFLYVRAKPSKKKLVKVTFHKGDILIRANKNGTRPNAPLADPNLLWPSGIVEFKFYRTFPRYSP